MNSSIHFKKSYDNVLSNRSAFGKSIILLLNNNSIFIIAEGYIELAKIVAGNTVNMNVSWVEGEPVLMTRKEISV